MAYRNKTKRNSTFDMLLLKVLTTKAIEIINDKSV